MWLHGPLYISFDFSLHFVCMLGIACSTAALALATRTAAGGTALLWGLLWALYLSLVSLGQTFLSFQWDILLLEARAGSRAPTPASFLSRAIMPSALVPP